MGLMAQMEMIYGINWPQPPVSVAAPVRPLKPWERMTPDEKMELSQRLLHSLCYETPRDARHSSTTNPGPMPLDEMMLLHRIYGPERDQTLDDMAALDGPRESV